MKQTSAIAPVLCGAGYAVSCLLPHRSRKTYQGRAGRQGSNRTHGPRHLAISRLVEAGPSSPFRATTGKPQVRQVPRRPARGV